MHYNIIYKNEDAIYKKNCGFLIFISLSAEFSLKIISARINTRSCWNWRLPYKVQCIIKMLVSSVESVSVPSEKRDIAAWVQLWYDKLVIREGVVCAA